MNDRTALGQSAPGVQEAPVPSGLHLMDGIAGLHSLPQHSVDLLLTDPPYGTTRNFWDVPLPLPELWEAVKWAVKPDGAILFFAQCPYDIPTPPRLPSAWWENSLTTSMCTMRKSRTALPPSAW